MILMILKFHLFLKFQMNLMNQHLLMFLKNQKFLKNLTNQQFLL
jgi:hypothetical protein